MKTDLLASRHIGINEEDTAVMLRKIGVDSLDELINKTIPANIRLKEPLALAKPLTEYEFGKHIAELANKNKLYTTYIGLGWYNTITPAVIQRNVFENPVWYTSYTPYQTEVSQGRLEALMNFQTAVFRRPKNNRPLNFLYIDELACLLHPSFSRIWQLYRQYHVCAACIIQNFSQFDEQPSTKFLLNVALLILIISSKK